MTLYVIGSFFPALAARDRVNCVRGKEVDRAGWILATGNQAQDTKIATVSNDHASDFFSFALFL